MIETHTTSFGVVHRSRTGSGAVILTEQARRTPIVAIRVQVRRGSGHEPDGQSGLASLLLRMLQQGTLRRSAQELQLAFAELGAEFETGAGLETSALDLVCAREVLEPALELLLEVLCEPALLEAELVKEREQALERIRARRDNYLESAFDEFGAAFYRGHPYRHPPLGYEHTVAALGVAHLNASYAEWFGAGNLVVAGVGDLDHQLLVERIERRLPAAAPTAPAPDPSVLSIEVPADPAQIAYSYRDSAQAWVVVGCPAPSLGHPDHPALKLLNTVLGGSMSSRLFIEVREKRSLAYQVGSVYNAYRGPSYLGGYLGTTPAQFQQARDTVEAELRRVARVPVAEDELEASRKYLRGSTLLAQETNRARATRYAMYEALDLGFDYGDRVLAAALATTAEQAMAAAARHFNRWVTAAVMPAPDRASAAASPTEVSASS